MKQATPEMATVRAILAATVLLAILSAVLGPGAMAESAGIPDLYEGLVILDDPAYFIFQEEEEAAAAQTQSALTSAPPASAQPSVEPTTEPTTEATGQPTAEPTPAATTEPTETPSTEPEPTEEPVPLPTVEPTHAPEPAYTIVITPPTGWRNTASAQVRIEITDEHGTGWDSVRASTGSAGWTDLTEAFRQGNTAELEVADNGTLVVRVTDPHGGYHEEQAKINCFDRQAPTVTAGIDGEPLHIEATDDLSGVAGIQVNGLLFTALENGSIDVQFDEALRSYAKLAIRAYDFAGNFSQAVTLENPYYGYPATPTPAPTATPKPTVKPTKAPSGGGSASKPTVKPTATPTALPTASPVVILPTPTPVYIQTGPGQAFTQSGNMQTVDLLYASNTNKQFITVQSRGGQTYYLIIDYDKPIDEENEIYETYFLNLVDERDLLSLLSEEDMPTPTPTPSPTPVPTQVPTPVPAQTQQEKDTGTGWLALAVLCLLAAGGALWFLKSRKSGAPARPAFMEYEEAEEEEPEMEEPGEAEENEDT